MDFQADMIVPTVSIVSATGLGDGLIQLVMAHNFSLNGWSVRFYSDYVSELNAYASEMSLRKYPDPACLSEELGSSHLILYDSACVSKFECSDLQQRWLAENGICYSTSHAKPVHDQITVEAIQKRLPEGFKELSHRVVRLNKSLRSRTLALGSAPVSRQLASALNDTLQFDTRSGENGIVVPTGDETSRPNSVILHPTSSKSRKNWSEQRYLALARLLQEEGWNPVFTVSPSERAHWLSLTSGEFEVPEFANIAELARFYAVCRFFIGNDSGNAHLAATLGLRTLVIFSHCRPRPAWRPGWGCSATIAPVTLRRKNWQQHLSVGRLLKSFDRLVKASEKAGDIP